MVRDQKAAGSNPATSTENPRRIKAPGVFLYVRFRRRKNFIMYIAMYRNVHYNVQAYKLSIIAWRDS